MSKTNGICSSISFGQSELTAPPPFVLETILRVSKESLESCYVLVKLMVCLLYHLAIILTGLKSSHGGNTVLCIFTVAKYLSMYADIVCLQNHLKS